MLLKLTSAHIVLWTGPGDREYGEKIKFNGGSDPYIRLTASSDKSGQQTLDDLDHFFETALRGAQEN